MCGICGMMAGDPRGQVDAETVARMNEALAHRGPDDAGLWQEGTAALAMRRLSILDLPGGHQPMFNEDGRIAVVFNGEIYNFAELRRDLEAHGHHFVTNSDTEVIVHAYEQYGDDCLPRFNGMFAFALYDRNRRRLLLARDRLGIKPLFYAERDGRLAFASELPALRASGFVEDALNPGAIRDYFTFLYIPAPDTIYRDAWKLGPGEKLIFEDGRVSVEPYWRLEYRIDPTWTLDSAAERFLELARDSVRLQRISDVPLGAFLSGGMDSSTVVALLSECVPGPIKTFTIGFDDGHMSELAHARRVAQHFATDHTEEIMRPDLAAVAPKLLHHFGEPFADSSLIPTWLVSTLARRDVTVALSGDGGDELFAGYTWMRMARRVARMGRWPRPLHQGLKAAAAALPAGPLRAKITRALHQMALAPRDAFRLRETCFEPPLLERLLQQDVFNAAATAPDRFAQHAGGGPGDFENWMLYQDTVQYLPDDILVKVDRMSMAAALEARVPLLDHRLVEFAATVPFHLKYQHGISKRLVKHAIAPLLPPEILRQRKQGFGIPIHRWFRNELRGVFQETVLDAPGEMATLLNMQTVRGLFSEHAAGRADYGHHLFALLMFRHFMSLQARQRQ